MKTIPAEVQTLLKSRSMIGENKPAYEITSATIGGDRYDFTAFDTSYQPQTAYNDYSPSYVQLADGRVLFMFSRGATWDTDPANLYQCYYSDVETLISGNDTVQNETLVLANMYTPRATLFHNPAGELFFMLAYNGKTTEYVAKVQVYKSAKGDGSDWALYSTLHTCGFGAANQIYNSAVQTAIGLPYFSGGRMIVPYPHFYSLLGGYLAALAGIMTSDDGGLTWTSRFTAGYGSFSMDIQSISRQVGAVGGELWFCYVGAYLNYEVIFMHSTDNGATWASVFSIVQDMGEAVIFSDSENMYLYSYGIGNHNPTIRKISQPPTALSDFEIVKQGLPIPFNSGQYCWEFLAAPVGNRVVISAACPVVSHYYYGMYVAGYSVTKTSLKAKSITVSRNKGMSGNLEIILDNKEGIYSPDNTGTGYEHALWPNAEITVKQGYGEGNLVKTFTGLVDSITMSNYPAEIRVQCRDKGMKLAIDQTVSMPWNGGTSHNLTYWDRSPEWIFADLAAKGGIPTGQIDATGLTIDEHTFSWESYADAFQFLAEISGNFEFGANTDGAVFFREDTTPADPVVAWVFREGQDLIKMDYTISDAEIYQKAAVYGKDPTDGHVVFASKDYTSRNYYKVLAQKYLKIDAADAAGSVATCQAIADKAEMLMRSRVRTVNFAAIANPYLEVGDYIQVIESTSTISEIYRILDLSTTMDPTGGYTMQITCYHHSAA